MIKPAPWSDFVGKYCCCRPGVVKLNNLMINYSYTDKRKSLVGTLKNVNRAASTFDLIQISIQGMPLPFFPSL